MENRILVGCDLHDKTMLLKFARGRETEQKRCFENVAEGRKAMIAMLKKFAGGEQIVFAYEAAGLGFCLCDELAESGITCHVLAPTKIARSVKHRSSKTDEKDAERILEVLRGHYLAGNKLPNVWIPDKQTRDDREIVRARLDAQNKCAEVKTQIRMLLKRNEQLKRKPAGESWTRAYRAWLKALSECDAPLAFGARQSLSSLLRQLDALEKELKTLDEAIALLSQTARYSAGVAKLTELKGVGLIVAMVFLTEIGDATRFKNRREIGAYLGLAPTSYETGETNDRKGHITRQGPSRVRYVLNQAAWSRVRFDAKEKAVYERIAAKNPKHKKVAVVAAMRRLAIRMWHGAVAVKAAG
jgi:transposase